MKKFAQNVAFLALLLGLMGQGMGADFKTVGGISAFNGELWVGEIWTAVTFENCVDVNGGWFASKDKQYPGGGISLRPKELVQKLGGSYEWKLGAFDPSLGFSCVVNFPKLFDATNKDRLVDLVLHADFLKLKF